ncbi:hypothetical protein ACJX0J_039373, partial [Zea mays]
TDIGNLGVWGANEIQNRYFLPILRRGWNMYHMDTKSKKGIFAWAIIMANFYWWACIEDSIDAFKKYTHILPRNLGKFEGARDNLILNKLKLSKEDNGSVFFIGMNLIQGTILLENIEDDDESIEQPDVLAIVGIYKRKMH